MKYTGPLGKPIVAKRIGALDIAGQLLAATQESSAIHEKLPALFAAHNIQNGDWQGLAMALAKTHVTGFKVVKPAGRRPEWDAFVKAEFRLDVDTIIEKNGLVVIEAIKQVIRLDTWANKTKPMTIGALEKHYYNADLGWVKVLKNARAYESIVATN